jgi:hypothetical protein
MVLAWTRRGLEAPALHPFKTNGLQRLCLCWDAGAKPLLKSPAFFQ